MPHQLRRIIAINIRNSIDGNPSGRIAELDPRGGVLAVGDNGVGKTTFLRLIPLFYGATPSQVLKGSGKASMIRHTLPDSSSAVAYEYERESEANLCTVVMYAKEGEDVPDFRIVSAGFDETFFYDEDEMFVPRAQFADRLRARGINVSPVLALNEYRSVILNERMSSSKNAKQLSLLAREYSLGPRPLHNLNQIAAAMASEKISFRDLQNIVLERVAEDQATTTRRQNVRELKQRKEDVNAWLERRAHMAEILKRKSDADRMQERAIRIKGIHLDLCSLHVAVKAALSQALESQSQLTNERKTHAESITLELGALDAEIDKAHQSKTTAKGDWNTQNNVVQAVLSRQKHFEGIDAEKLADNQARETALKQQSLAKEHELDRLKRESGSIKVAVEEQLLSIEQSAQAQRSEIADRKASVNDDHVKNVLAIGQSKEEALHSLQEPPRLAEIAEDRTRLSVNEGTINEQLRNPSATQNTLDARDEAAGVLDQRRLDRERAKDEAGKREKEEDAARATLDGAIEALEDLEASQKSLLTNISELTAKLTPEPGSLLEFVRGSEDPLWTHASKLISEELIHRTDLSPVLVDPLPANMADASVVTIGNVSLSTHEIPTPPWFSMEVVRERLDAAKSRLGDLSSLISRAKEQAQKQRKNLEQATSDLQTAKANLALAESSLDIAQKEKARLDVLVQAERQTVQEQARQALVDLKAALKELGEEEKAIRSGFDQERQEIIQGCKRKIAELEAATKRQIDALDAEARQVEITKVKDQQNAKNDYQRKLAGMGLDTERIKTVEEELSGLSLQLSEIAKNRHEVADWVRFCQDEMPYLQGYQRKVEELQTAYLQASKRCADLEHDRHDLQKRFEQTLDELDTRIRSCGADIQRLEELRDQKLRDFVNFVPSSVYANRSVLEIDQEVTRKLRSLVDEDAALRSEILSLRNEFEKKEGGPQDWLKLKRQELPDKQTWLEHEYHCLEAQQMCDWFERSECGSYIEQLTHEMNGFFENASVFVSRLETFDRLVATFNTELGRALATAEHFERFKDLSVRVTSSVSQQAFLKVLRQMRDRSPVVALTGRAYFRMAMELPSDEDAALVREYREILRADGGVLVDLNEQVRLEFSLYENGKRSMISNEEEFRAVSSNGNSALITAMFLMGFVQMIRGSSPVRLVWVTDELGRFDAKNVGAFLKTLALNNIDVISASPSVDPALARHFPRLSLFESTGAIFTDETNNEREAALEPV